MRARGPRYDSTIQRVRSVLAGGPPAGPPPYGGGGGGGVYDPPPGGGGVAGGTVGGGISVMCSPYARVRGRESILIRFSGTREALFRDAHGYHRHRGR